MSAPILVPLDDAFVRRLRDNIRDQSHLFSPVARAHWQALFNHFEGRTDFEIRAYIAQNFNTNNWLDSETWFDARTQFLFQGYDRTEFEQANHPALNDQARDHYSPSNTLGRGHLFPTLPVIDAGPATIDEQEYLGLPQNQRERWQLTSAFGGYRFQRVPNRGTTPGGGALGVPADNTSGTSVPLFDNSITDDPVNNNAGTQGTQPATTGGTNPFGTPPPPFPSQTGTNNVPTPGQPGGTTGGQPGLAGPPLPADSPVATGTNSGNQNAGPAAGGTVGYPVLPAGTFPPPVTTGTTPAGARPPGTSQSTPPTAGTTSGTGGSQSGTTGTTPGTPESKATGPIQTPNAPVKGPAVPGATSGGPSSSPFGIGSGPAATGATLGPPPLPFGIGSGPAATGATLGPPPLPFGIGNVPTPGVTSGGPPPLPFNIGSGPAATGATSGGPSSSPFGIGNVPTPGDTPGGPSRPPPGPGNLPATTGVTPGGTVPSLSTLGVPLITPSSTGRDTAPPPAPGGISSGAPNADGSVPNPLQPSASDMTDSFTWRGQQQPPVGTRLREIMVLLDEGDIDREMHWETYVRETREFLEWLERGEGPALGPESALLVQQALQKIQAHNLFNQTHYGPNTPNRIVTADNITAPEPRLKYNGKLPLVLGKERKDNEHLQPQDFPTHPRAEMIVNDQWLTDVERRAGLTEEKRADRQAGLSRDEEEWWRLGQHHVPAPNNAALRLEQTFEECIAADDIGFHGWVETRLEGNGSLTRELFNGARLGDGKDCYARERAVRRAGLQAALRQFSSNENTVANTPWRRVRLPLSADEVKVMRKNTGAGPARKYELSKLQPHQLHSTDGKNDPQGITANMAQFWANQNRDMATAREAVVRRAGFGLPPVAPVPGQPAIRAPSVLPPMSLWGAYVDSGLSAENEYHRQMLKEMRTTRKLFEREMKIAPRSLLTHMNTLYLQGLTSSQAEYLPDGAQQMRTPNSIRQRDEVLARGTTILRDLDKMEIYWIRFLLTQSITPDMTKDLEPRASLFILFADKLARIFNDVSDPLFPDNNTRVSIEDLLDYIHDRTEGPVQRVKFYAHDVQMFLERLHSQGRCRYQEDWRCYGWVMRPIPTCHPEQLVRWTVPDDLGQLRPEERTEDVVLAPRFDRLRNWHSLVRRGLQNSPLDQRVEDYFLVLAYRWGDYMQRLTGENGMEQQWKTQAARPSGEMSNAIGDYRAEFDRITQWNDAPNNPLVRLVKATLTDRANDNTLTAEASLQLVRDNIIKEAVKNDSVLWPARSANNYLDPADEKVRPKVWGWARPEVRGKVKRFFSVNRWPVQLQTQRRQDIITRDKDMDPDMIWKPEVEDPTPSKYYRPKARPYVDEKVQFRSGHRNFLIGDTPHQKQVVIDRMFAQMGRAMRRQRNDNAGGTGDAPAPGGPGGPGAPNADNQVQDIPEPGFIERWSSYLLTRFEEEDPDRYQEPGAKLRKFHRQDIPESEDSNKRPADGDAPDQQAPKRRRRRGPQARYDDLLDGDEDEDEDADDGGEPPARGPPARRVRRAARVQRANEPPAGAQNAEADDEGEEYEDEDDEDEEGENFWDLLSMATAI